MMTPQEKVCQVKALMHEMGMTLKEACNLLGYDSQEISNVLQDSDSTVEYLKKTFGF
jgi:antitoxin component HigA of HigAB toxin-antitoxin module